MPSQGVVEGADTLPPEDVAGESAPPVARWDRYELAEILGKGGMGVVYKARDRRLDRTVAIKFILGADPNLTLRLLREARAQARIDHPNVCRVYEVGEVEGRAYIAIQFVDGEPLGRAAAHMSLDEKIAVMRDVAVAIQEAHRLGIIHRDLKPGNVLVERTEDGRWLPIVMDFGLAREATLEAGLTQSGQLIGTPAYMSPEQARGGANVDRRSDVYSLGATLYELLTGRPPFGDPALAIALDQVLHADPPAPRGLVPTLPVDLETITLKCLDKDPGQRYPSARALADDLARYLDGEAILGRRPSLVQRLRASARRHRALWVLGVWSAAIIVALGVFGVRSWLISRDERARTGERTRLAERLGRDSEEIEWLLRAAYELPLHDTRPEREVIRARMRAIAGTPHDLGELGDAVVFDALGRGHLALHEWGEANAELERAASSGLDTPELHAARGRVLGELYHRALEEARRSGDKSVLAARQQELEARYLVPALVELEQARAAGDSAALLDALVALYRRDYATAEARALAAANKAPWLFEARKLAGDAAYAAALTNVDRGKYEAARPQLEHAAALYGQAAEVARSDASVHVAAAQAWLELADLDYRRSQPPRQPLEQAIAAIDRAIVADPEGATAYTTRAYILFLRWRARVDGAAEQVPLLEQMAAAAQHAVTLDPDNAAAWDALGNMHTWRGTHELYHGGQAAPWLRKALVELARALAIRPGDPWTHNDIGVAHRWIGTELDNHGEDPMPEFREALASYRRATAIDPAYAYAWSNQTDIQAAIAEYQAEHGIDPAAVAAEARRAGERGLAINPSLDLLLTAMARSQLALAEFLVDHGGDPTAALASARSDLERAENLRPTSLSTRLHRARVERQEARFRLRSGKDATAAIADAREAIAEAMQRAPASPSVWTELAELELVAAAATSERARLVAARADADKAIALDDQDPTGMVIAAKACLELAKPKPDRAIVERGLAYVDQALALVPRLPKALALREELARLR